MEPKVLIIEDDPGTARLVEIALANEGYQLFSAPNGLKGLDLARAESVDLVLLDLMLPGIDGFEVLSRLRADPQTTDVPVVIVSARSQAIDKYMAAKVGADAYLTKPYESEELRNLIHSLLNSEPEETAIRSKCVLILGPHSTEATHVALYTGLALARKGRKTTTVDLRPFSIEHPRLLNISPCPDPVSLTDPKTAGRLADLVIQHPGGLRLLNNLEGSGEAGRITPEDAVTVIEALSVEGDFVLIDLPLYPADLLSRLADCCAQVFLVIRDDRTSLPAARSALVLVEQAGVDLGRVDIVLVGPPLHGGLTGLDRAVLGIVLAELRPEAPDFQALADRVQGLRRRLIEGGERHVA